MLLFLLLLILAAVGVGIYANQNPGTHPVNFLQWHWAAVADWVPVVVAAAVIGGLFLLYMLYSGLVHGVRIGSMRRRVSTREQAINDMRDEHQRMREENARLRSELRGMDRGVTATSGERRLGTGTDREPMPAYQDTDREGVETTDRSRTAPPYRARPSFGERVRAFFSAREPAGY
jgi:uncharacterized integral membrane protein